MSLVVTLYLWTVVASNGVAASSNSVLHKDWRPIGTFEFAQTNNASGNVRQDPMDLCLKAAKDLGLEQTRFRCIRAK